VFVAFIIRHIFLTCLLLIIAICAPGCSRGSCFLPGECICEEHWTGPLCDKCSFGWGGADCSQGLAIGMINLRFHILQRPAVMDASMARALCLEPAHAMLDTRELFVTRVGSHVLTFPVSSSTAVCDVCVRGECTAPGACQCEAGWSGLGCNIRLTSV
jgi:hypothetical protein